MDAMRAMKAQGIAALLAGALALSACASSSAHSGAAHWGYHGADGPPHWATLESEFAACGNGTRQSPIDIVDAATSAQAPPNVHYRNGRAVVVNNGHSIQADARGGGGITDDATNYPLVQMHFHAPSETTFAGRHAPVELHFVNTDTDGRSVVVAAMVQPGAENPAWQPYVDALGLKKGVSTTIALDWSKLLPSSAGSVRFDGSLTTPPCTEGVRWVVLTTPITMSQSQIDAFTHAYSGNNRPTQPSHGRLVTESAAAPR
jgi:carbonic anhydrase